MRYIAMHVKKSIEIKNGKSVKLKTHLQIQDIANTVRNIFQALKNAQKCVIHASLNVNLNMSQGVNHY